jgi:hypothetical protein
MGGCVVRILQSCGLWLTFWLLRRPRVSSEESGLEEKSTAPFDQMLFLLDSGKEPQMAHVVLYLGYKFLGATESPLGADWTCKVTRTVCP